MGAGLTVHSVVCVASLLTLVVAAGLIWSKMFQISSRSYDLVRLCLAIGAGLYAIYCVWWFVTYIVSLNTKPDQDLAQHLKLQLVYISIAWIIVPPLWFFVEYFAVRSGCIKDFPGDEQNLKRTKDYADYASKVWAGVIALILAVVALNNKLFN